MNRVLITAHLTWWLNVSQIVTGEKNAMYNQKKPTVLPAMVIDEKDYIHGHKDLHWPIKPDENPTKHDIEGNFWPLLGCPRMHYNL